jgi:hypothetical protein
MLCDGSELWGRPPLAHRIPSLWIFDQPSNLPLKVLLLGQVDVLHLMCLFRLLHHLGVVQQLLLEDNFFIKYNKYYNEWYNTSV